MGVHGLWFLLEPTGRPIKLEALANKVLAIDISSWLYQYVKALRDEEGALVRNAHLLGLFKRLCILLFHNIKPVIVFDGPAPTLKRHVLAARRQLRDRSEETLQKTAHRLFVNQIRSHALAVATGQEAFLTKRKEEEDMFNLPPVEEPKKRSRKRDHAAMEMASQEASQGSNLLDEELAAAMAQEQSGGESDEEQGMHEEMERIYNKFFKKAAADIDYTKIDIYSDDFKSLPPEIQHDIIIEVQERAKRWSRFQDIKRVRQSGIDFSQMQMERLMKKNDIARRLDEVREQLQYTIVEGGFESHRIASEDSRQFILKYLKDEDVGSLKLALQTTRGEKIAQQIEEKRINGTEQKSNNNNENKNGGGKREKGKERVLGGGFGRDEGDSSGEGEEEDGDLEGARKEIEALRAQIAAAQAQGSKLLSGGAIMGPPPAKKLKTADPAPPAEAVVISLDDMEDVPTDELFPASMFEVAAPSNPKKKKDTVDMDEDEQMALALALSMAEQDGSGMPAEQGEDEDEELQLAKAISLSIQAAAQARQTSAQGSDEGSSGLSMAEKLRASQQPGVSPQKTPTKIRDLTPSPFARHMNDNTPSPFQRKPAANPLPPTAPKNEKPQPPPVFPTPTTTNSTGTTANPATNETSPKNIENGDSIKRIMARTESEMGGGKKAREGEMVTESVEKSNENISDKAREEAGKKEKSDGDGKSQGENDSEKDDKLGKFELGKSQSEGLEGLEGFPEGIGAGGGDEGRGDGEGEDWGSGWFVPDDVLQKSLGEGKTKKLDKSVVQGLEGFGGDEGEEEEEEEKRMREEEEKKKEEEEVNEGRKKVCGWKEEEGFWGGEVKEGGDQVEVEGEKKEKEESSLAALLRKRVNEEREKEINEGKVASKKGLTLLGVKIKSKKKDGGVEKKEEKGDENEVGAPMELSEDGQEGVLGNDSTRKAETNQGNEKIRRKGDNREQTVVMEIETRQETTEESGGAGHEELGEVEVKTQTGKELTEEDRRAVEETLAGFEDFWKSDSEDEADAAVVSTLSKEDILALQQSLFAERAELMAEQRTNRRDAEGITSDMLADTKELLQLFGIPWVDSPAEAEAQCAELERRGHTQGTITEDSDSLLFGARTVVKHMFSRDHEPEIYRMDEIVSKLNLTRRELVDIALLSGSDYTEGIYGVGPVTSVEILCDFGPEEKNEDSDDEDCYSAPHRDPLVHFCDWMESVHLARKAPPPEGESAFRRKLRAMKRPFAVPMGFPDPQVRRAYFSPLVDSSEASFDWSMPDLDRLRQYAYEKFNWDQAKTDAILVPVVQKLNNPKIQLQIKDFFSILPPVNRDIKSKRVASALNTARNKQALALAKKRQKVTNQQTRASTRNTRGRARGRGRGSGSNQSMRENASQKRKAELSDDDLGLSDKSDDESIAQSENSITRLGESVEGEANDGGKTSKRGRGGRQKGGAKGRKTESGTKTRKPRGKAAKGKESDNEGSDFELEGVGGESDFEEDVVGHSRRGRGRGRATGRGVGGRGERGGRGGRGRGKGSMP